MEPARYTIAFSSEPQDLVSGLAPVLAAQGSPAVTVSREGGSLTFVSETGDFMLRARVADALTTVFADWQERVAGASGLRLERRAGLEDEDDRRAGTEPRATR